MAVEAARKEHLGREASKITTKQQALRDAGQ